MPKTRRRKSKSFSLEKKRRQVAGAEIASSENTLDANLQKLENYKNEIEERINQTIALNQTENKKMFSAFKKKKPDTREAVLTENNNLEADGNIFSSILKAAGAGDVNALKTVVDPWFGNGVLGAGAYKTTSSGTYIQTPLMAAIEKNHMESILFLIAQPAININTFTTDNKTRSNETPLHLACSIGNVDVVDLLCSLPEIILNNSCPIKKEGIAPKYNTLCVTPYIDACIKYRGDDVEDKKNRIRDILVAKGYTISADDIYWASMRGDVELVKKICANAEFNYIDNVYLNPKDQGRNIQTPYTTACSQYNGVDKEEKIKDIRDVIEAKGFKPPPDGIYDASRFGDLDMVKRYLSKEPESVNKEYNFGLTAHMAACDVCFDLNPVDKNNKKKQIRDAIEQAGYKFSYYDFRIAAMEGNVEFVKKMSDQFINELNTGYDRGHTIVEVACSRYEGADKKQKILEIEEFLKAKGAKPIREDTWRLITKDSDKLKHGGRKTNNKRPRKNKNISKRRH
jgi:ankyrin repeat protein